MARAAAPEFGGHERGGQAAGSQPVERGDGDLAGAVPLGHLRAEGFADLAGQGDAVGDGRGVGKCGSHVSKVGTAAITR